MPQFEVEPAGQPPAFVRARDAEGAVRRHLGADAPDPALGEPEPGSGWQPVRLGGEAWGRVRPRDRMRFRRD